MKFELLADLHDESPAQYTGTIKLTVERDEIPKKMADFDGGTGVHSFGPYNDHLEPVAITNNRLVVNIAGVDSWIRSDLTSDLPRTSFSQEDVMIKEGARISLQPVVDPGKVPGYSNYFIRHIRRVV